MEIEVLVSLVDLKRAFRRLLTRLSDESEAGGEFIVFGAGGNSLEITAARPEGGSEEVSHGIDLRVTMGSASFLNIVTTKTARPLAN